MRNKKEQIAKKGFSEDKIYKNTCFPLMKIGVFVMQ
ncbi:hypothetical protein LMOSLCC2482_1606 [Listeria monocytogenes serotype 7 str. SLCC2482]|nr:hypothetical protein LMOf2365_1571 [Listeria monocytogenes serotype 4b str. F2365]ADB68444.1 hypothetical protein LM5578_1696 [Listeria monocytogenes 08-5578]ADB71489.1 hypothetical protein LM5923_1648 [Listeria monocytogenes 08-5923]AHF29388.1 hypothetical protein A407_1615 [Listeria monocytogenes serotype 4b str. 81-0861]AHF32362.1 hypothetical protein A430_1684 [Listeria monocytogenes serotype 1/2a str. 08-6569]AHF35353.1 hypothetical protein A431_1684 [Listeria monocytogenes serotype 1/